MASSVQIEALPSVPVGRRHVEVVERKGIGHPDTICDCVAEALSRELCRVYLERAGRVLHHNVDKALLVAGASRPAFGGGRVDAPMRLVLSGRATSEVGGLSLPVAELATETARSWFRAHLRFVEPEHLVVETALQQGSAQLTDAFARETLGANDTSVGIGYAPMTDTERLVLEAEGLVHSPGFHERFPAAGEDVKVMGVRVGRRLELTLAIAFVDRFVADERTYFAMKAAMKQHFLAELGARLGSIESLAIAINALDREGRGADGAYLTVLGTSAEGADGGEVGRGNRVNGLISFLRPHSMEAAAGKNPVSHVGKIYNLLAGRIARRVHADVPGIEEARVLLCSRIGSPLECPWIASAQLGLTEGVSLGEVRATVREILEHELAGAGDFVDHLVRDGMPVC